MLIEYTKQDLHTLLLPRMEGFASPHNKWSTLDYSSVDKLIIGSDFNEGCMEELRPLNPIVVYNVYGSTGASHCFIQ